MCLGLLIFCGGGGGVECLLRAFRGWGWWGVGKQGKNGHSFHKQGILSNYFEEARDFSLRITGQF